MSRTVKGHSTEVVMRSASRQSSLYLCSDGPSVVCARRSVMFCARRLSMCFREESANVTAADTSVRRADRRKARLRLRPSRHHTHALKTETVWVMQRSNAYYCDAHRLQVVSSNIRD